VVHTDMYCCDNGEKI